MNLADINEIQSAKETNNRIGAFPENLSGNVPHSFPVDIDINYRLKIQRKERKICN